MEKVLVEKLKRVEGKNGRADFYVISSDEKEYLCFQKAIADKEGQEVEGEVTTLKSGKFSFNLPGETSYAKQPYKPSAGGGFKGRSPEDLALTAKTMSASYAKDLCVACYAADLSFNRVIEMFGQAYDAIYGKITGAETRHESAKPATEAMKEKYQKTESKKEENKPESKEPESGEVPKAPTKTDRNEVTCGGANAKLKGKTVSDKFCKVCSFRAKCEVRNAPAPLDEKSTPTSSEKSKKSSDPAPASSAPSDQGQKAGRVPVAFIMKAVSEQKRVGKEAFHVMIETFGVKSASEIKDTTQQEAFLGCLAALGDEK